MRLTVVLAAALALASCRKPAEPPAPEPPRPVAQPAPVLAPVEVKVNGALRAVRCGEVTAEWLGTPPGPPAPTSFGVQSLRFRVKDVVTEFTPRGALEFSDWSFDVFSPDCTYVLLLVDRYGPYVAVKTSALSGWLDGGVGGVELRYGEGTARVHSDGHFVSAAEVEYQAACCGGVDVVRAPVDDAARQSVVFSAPEAPKGLRRVSRGYEVVP